MKELSELAERMKLAEDITELDDVRLEALAQLLYNFDSEQALTLMRYIGIMDMETRIEQREGFTV